MKESTAFVVGLIVIVGSSAVGLLYYFFQKQKRITIKAFRILNYNLSKCYKDDAYPWLRFCLFEHLNIGDLENSNSNAMYLFNVLQNRGSISPTNVNLLLEITELTELNHAKQLLKEYMRDNKIYNSDQTQLSPYRKRLFKAMRNVDGNGLKYIISFYALSPNVFTNVWDVVFALEKNKDLTNETTKIKTFANLLNETAKDLLLNKVPIIRRNWKSICRPTPICIVLAALIGAIIILLMPNIISSYPPSHYFENDYDTTEYGEMIKKRFQTMNADLSRYYEGDRYYWLRFCLIDYLSVGDITDAIGNDLFNALQLKGLITPTNVSLLLEITKLTEVKPAEDLIRGYIKDNKLQIMMTQCCQMIGSDCLKP